MANLLLWPSSSIAALRRPSKMGAALSVGIDKDPHAVASALTIGIDKDHIFNASPKQL